MAFDLLLIHPPYHRRSGSGKIFPLGLGYIASVAERNGFSVKILDCSLHFDSLTANSLHRFESWLQGELKTISPNFLIGVGPCTTSSLKALFVISSVCSYLYPAVPLVYGGPLVSLEEFNRLFFETFKASGLIAGDGELVVLETLKALRESQDLQAVDGITTPFTSLKTNVINDLDSLPFPVRPNISKYKLSIRRDLLESPFATIMANRGCPYRCSFCVSPLLRNGKYSSRSYKSIFDEIQFLIDEHQVRAIVFYDDTLFRTVSNGAEEIHNFCDNFSKLSQSVFWQLEMRPDLALTLNVEDFKVMFDSGCRQINFGIETSNYSGSNSVGKDFDLREFGKTLDIIRKEVPLLRTSGTFIIGGSSETTESARSTIEYSLSLALTFAHFYPLEVYPGTEIYTDYNIGFDRWLADILSDEMPWGEVIYENSNLNKFEILQLINEAYKEFYSRPSWQEYASSLFGKNYDAIQDHIAKWTRDRFGLMG